MLTNSNLSNFFHLPDANDTHYSAPTNTFDFVSRKSKILTVTLGESWTWGSDIDPTDNPDIRRESVFGNLVAKKLDSDWLNLACPGVGNFYIAEKAQELGHLIPQLEYDHIYVICTLTELGRQLNSRLDQTLDFFDWFKTNIHTSQDYNKFLIWLNRLCIDQILNSLQFKHVTVRIASNFVDPCGFGSDETFIHKPWAQLLAEQNNLDYSPTCYAVFHGLERLNQILDLQAGTDIPKQLFLEWMISTLDLGKQRLKVINDSKYYQRHHPLADGHLAWADYLLASL